MNRLKMLVITMLLVCIAGFTSCKQEKSSNEILLTVASTKAMSKDWSGIEAERCVIREDDGLWQVLFSNISGFRYEDGYEYRLKVRKVVPEKDLMDAYDYYELVEQLSKEKKQTIFKIESYNVTNNAKAEGEKLSNEDVIKITKQIIESSPFNGVTSINLECTNFYFESQPRSMDYTYRTNTGKSGRCNKTLKQADGGGTGSLVFTFEFDGDVFYEYQMVGSPYRVPYLLLDVTEKYKVDYPNLELAQSGIRLSMVR